MKTGTVFNILGKLLIFLSIAFLVPIPVSLYFNDGMVGYFLLSAVITAGSGLLLSYSFVLDSDLSHRDGFAVVTFGWLGMALFGALPYFMAHEMPYLDCFFESLSGFTTTGSTILDDIGILGESLIFWRSMTQWLGGMGIIVLTLAILPMLGVGGMQLFKAEAPGPTKDRLTPRIANTAKILWSIYLALTFGAFALLMLGGLSFYHAICHAFSTVATGGYSPHNESIGFYDSSWIDYVTVLFMFLGGINFALHYSALRGNPLEYFKNEEFRFYLGVTIAAAAIIMLANHSANIFTSFSENLRFSLFQTVSLKTSSGFTTTDYDTWPQISRVLLVVVMFFGGCAGSTGGGMKNARLLLLWKHLKVQMTRLVHPRAVISLKFQGKKVPDDVIQSVMGFFFLYILLFIGACLLVASQGMDFETTITSVTATLNNVGPGLAGVGATQTYAHLSDFTKVVLIFCMLVGRLELYTVIILLTPRYWSETKKPELRWSRKA